MNDNPYSPPRTIAQRTAGRDWSFIGAASFWIATVSTAIGFASLFIRNLPPGNWLLLGLTLFVVAIFLGKRRYRIAAICGLVICRLLLASAIVTLRNLRSQNTLQRQWVQQSRELGIRP